MASARLLTEAALRLSGITHIEIHHYKANLASAGVPRSLGFWLVAEVPREIEAPAEIGIEWQWRMDRELGAPIKAEPRLPAGDAARVNW